MPIKSRKTIDLNIADENVLVKKINISLRMARRIIAFRPYRSVDQLNKIAGLDPLELQRILPLVSVDQNKSAPEPLNKKRSGSPGGKSTSTEIGKKPRTGSQVSKPGQGLRGKHEPRSPVIRPPYSPPARVQESPWNVNIALILILLIGAYFRFTGLNWDQGQHQHPDERYISMVADQIRGVEGITAYFDTQTSTLNPLRFGSYAYGMLPLFLTRMVAEWVQMTGYDTITLVGRAMSGLFDLIAVWMLYLVGKRLYNKRIGLLAASLYAAAVLPIQLSHYFTVDSFSTIFIIASFYFALQSIPIQVPDGKISRSNLIYFGLFGFTVGLAGACKVNTLPVFGMIILAGIAKIITDWKKADFRVVIKFILWGWAIAAFFVFLAFRVFQPYAFSGPGLLGVRFNQDWLKVLQEVIDQVAGNSDWPPNTHWTNRSITYAWMNMVTWGLGWPLGLAGWLGWGWAAVQIWNGKWRNHLLPFVWVAAYFFWQNIQFWRYMRYFLPIYPFVILFAAWALIEIFDHTQASRVQLLSNGTRMALQFSNWRRTWRGAAGFAALGIVLIGTYVYALAFIQIYNHPLSRIAASRWMLANISGPMNVIVKSSRGDRTYPVSINSNQVVVPGETGSSNIHVLQDGTISSITTTDIRQIGVLIYFRLTRDEPGADIVTEGRLAINDDVQDEKQEIPFGDTNLTPDETYYFHYKIQNSSEFSLSNVSLLDVDQEQGSILPVNLNLESQSPGTIEGSLVLQPGQPLKLNRLRIGYFHQVFIPTETTFKVGIYKEGEENSPLGESSQTLAFSRPGNRLAPTFILSPMDVSGGQTYLVKYEITNGAPLRVLGENFTLETSWDDALPLNIDQYEVQGGIFSPLNLELYEPDTPEKRKLMIKVLSESNYIVIPSNRAYDAMPRLPLRYPLTLKYYQTLFDCDCSGDALEKRAYGLKPPFKSPLGFDLVAAFESPPSLGFLKFPDQSADESFTVYDHPRVMIFKKSREFSIDHVSDILKHVNLDEVFFQTPQQYTRLPTAMKLPADRLLAQREGGTWTDMFDRTSVFNVNEVLGGLAWYLSIYYIGLLAFPFVFKIFSGLPDRGYPLSRMAGLILTAWLAWFVSSIKLISFSQSALWVYLSLTLLLSLIFAHRQRGELSAYIHSHWKHILGIEAIFLVIFLFSLSVRLGNPDLWHPWLGGEKPMDFAFFNAVLKSVYFPPEHPWFSGHYINYYYYGYVIAAIPTKLLGLLPSIAYNLILPSWFAMTGIGIFCVGFNLVAGLRKASGKNENRKIEAVPSFWSRLFNRKLFIKSLPYLAGTFAMIAVLFMGNLYQVRVLWKYLPEAAVAASNPSSFGEHAGAFVGGAIRVLTGQSTLPGDNGRWYFEASRPILHDGPDTPIAEFPYFTFLYGDMHPHLLILPFYALAFAWMLNLLLRPVTAEKWLNRIPSLIAAGLVFGVFRASHTWDFPTFLALGVLAIIWNIWQARGSSSQKAIQLICIYVLAFAGIAVAFYWPFTQWFKTEYASLELWQGLRTPLVDYLFVFGMATFLIISLLIRDLRPKFQYLVYASLHDLFSRWRLHHYLLALASVSGLYVLWVSDYQVLAFGLPLLVGMTFFILFDHDLPILRRVTWILFGMGLSITLFVEVFVLKGDGGRSNTVFRFYNQAWIFFGLAISLAVVDLLEEMPYWPRPIKYVWNFMLGVLVLCAALYPLIATARKMADRWPDIPNPPHTLDGAVFMLGDANDPEGKNPAIYNDDSRLLNLSHDYAAILYMQDHIKGSPVIVEGHTEEYRWGSRFSIHTGLPSVVGWSWHVRQHNSLLDGAMVDHRIDEVNGFYNTEDLFSAAQFLSKYGVKYIVVGDLERGYYAVNGIDKFEKMVDQGILKMVFGDNSPETTTVFEVEEVKE